MCWLMLHPGLTGTHTMMLSLAGWPLISCFRSFQNEFFHSRVLNFEDVSIFVYIAVVSFHCCSQHYLWWKLNFLSHDKLKIEFFHSRVLIFKVALLWLYSWLLSSNFCCWHFLYIISVLCNLLVLLILNACWCRVPVSKSCSSTGSASELGGPGG